MSCCVPCSTNRDDVHTAESVVHIMLFGLRIVRWFGHYIHRPRLCSSCKRHTPPRPFLPLFNTNLRHNTLLTIPCRCVKCSEQFFTTAAHCLNLLYHNQVNTWNIQLLLTIIQTFNSVNIEHYDYGSLAQSNSVTCFVQ